MELLVVTLAHTLPGRDADILARVRLIADTVRNAPGLVTSRFFRSRGTDSFYLMLTTWEDEESWQMAQERHSPKNLLLGSATELLASVPEQWFMRYLWGYSRPAAAPLMAVAQLAHIRPDQIEAVQRGWLRTLRQQATQPLLAFGLLAQGTLEKSADSSALPPGPEPGRTPPQYGPIFLNLLSWNNDAERELFYANPYYQALNKSLSTVGIVHTLPLEPM